MGLNLIGRVGHELFVEKHDWRVFVKRLSEVDWSRQGELWQDTIVQRESGKMLVGQTPLKAAYRRLRDHLKLPPVAAK